MCTSVLEEGIDVPSCDAVIDFDGARRSRDAAEIQPRSSRDPAEIQPRSSRDVAEIQPRSSLDPAEM